MEQTVKTIQANDFAELILNRPGSYNAFDLEMLLLLAERLTGLASDPQVAGVVISGEGKAFCAGGDLRWIAARGDGPGATLHEMVPHFHRAVLEIRRMPKPVVAAINGMVERTDEK